MSLVDRRELAGITAMILAGGLGTRLRSAVADRPKVLAEVGGRPFLSYLLDRLDRAGVRRAVLCVGYLGEMVAEQFGGHYRRIRLSYSQERTLLGTGGALRLALGQVCDEQLLVLNGDSCLDTDLGALERTALLWPGAACLALARLENTRRFGRVELAEGDRIQAFLEKGASPGPGWINAGIYRLERQALKELPENEVISLEHDLFPRWAREGRLYGHRAEGAFLDIGTPESYARAESFFSRECEEVIG